MESDPGSAAIKGGTARGKDTSATLHILTGKAAARACAGCKRLPHSSRPLRAPNNEWGTHYSESLGTELGLSRALIEPQRPENWHTAPSVLAKKAKLEMSLKQRLAPTERETTAFGIALNSQTLHHKHWE